MASGSIGSVVIDKGLVFVFMVLAFPSLWKGACVLARRHDNWIGSKSLEGN